MPTVTGTITSPTSVVALPNALNDVTAYVTVNGSYSGVTVNFDGSTDNTNFYPVFGVRVDNGGTEATRALPANGLQMWGFNIAALATFRVRASAWTSGAANVSVISGEFPSPQSSGSTATGSVNVVGSLPTGSNVLGSVGLSGSLPAGTNNVGQVSVASLPTPVPVATQGQMTVLNMPAAPQTSSGSSVNLVTTGASALTLGVNVSAVSGTQPILQFFLDYLGADNTWYPFYASNSLYTTGLLVAHVGPGLQVPSTFGSTARLRWTVSGTNPSFTFSASVLGK